MKRFFSRHVCRTLPLVLGLLIPSIQAAPIPGLFNTGVDDTGALLGNGVVDPHYTIVQSADEAYPGPEAVTLTPGFPVGPWLAEGANSRWIAPRPDQGVGNAPGVYTYQLSFDLTGLDPASAQITGALGTDDGLNAVRLNGSALGGISSAGFGNLLAFRIPTGAPFIDGLNTLEFDVSNGGTAANPTGLRVELSGIANGMDESPSVLTPPLSQTVVVGDTVIFSAEALGTPPLSYQWLFNGTPLAGATEVPLTLTGVRLADAGKYSLRISNSAGSTNSVDAVLTVLAPFPGIYNTGVDANRAPIADGDVDSHYRLVRNDNDPSSAEAFAQTGLPSPPWIANSIKSRWVGPLVTPTAAGGSYTYQLVLDLTGYDPSTAFLAGDWAADNSGSLFLNGADTGFRSTSFAGFASFNLTSGFVNGANLLEFRLVNNGSDPTGLRVENLRGTAKVGGVGTAPPSVVTQPKGATRVITETLTLTVVADGTQPISYQWFHDGVAIADATTSTLTLPFLLATDGGDYWVHVTNALGSTNSARAHVIALQPQLGIFNTGVDVNGAALPTGKADPHYMLINNPDPVYSGPITYATAGPIPPWVANEPNSQWISARADGGATIEPGSYVYRLVFFINDAAEVANASISGSLATDDGNGGLFLNGTKVSVGGTGFGGMIPFSIPEGSPFVAGLNTLDFVVVNGGASANPSGLRVQDLALAGVTVTQQPALTLQQVGDVWQVSWPVSFNGYTLQESASVTGPWTDSATPAAEVGDLNVLEITPAGAAHFYRLRP